MKRKIWIVVPLFALAALVLIGCATRVRFDSQRPPNMNMVGIRYITVMPFTTNIVAARQIADHLTIETAQRINATGVFEPLVSYEIVVRPAMQRGNADQFVDALFRGRVTRFDSTRGTVQRTRRVDGQNVLVTFQTLTVDLSFEYEFVNPQTGAITGPVRRSGRSTFEAQNEGGLPAPVTAAIGIANNQLRQHFARDIAPFPITITRVMQSVGRNDPLRPAFDHADNMRRQGNYIGAREAFVAIANDFTSIPAAINAGILFEATGELEDGIFFLEQILERTGSSAVRQKVATLNNEVNAMLGIAALTADRTPADAISEHAVSTIIAAVGDEMRLWVHNDAGGVPVVEAVRSNIESAFINAGITVVDRGSHALIEFERNLQFSGDVADSDFLSVGGMAGANTIVRLNIIGAGNGRRLQVRVIDIERGTVVYQSNTSVLWRI